MAGRSGPDTRLALTQPRSLEEPTDEDLAESLQMLQELDRDFPTETAEGMARREAVLEELGRIVREWVVQVGVEAGVPDAETQGSTAQVVTMGSYRLGLVDPGSDIDTLCIAPPHVSREAFFCSFVDKLKRRDSVSECVPIPDAFTPIIKLKMSGVSIDLLFARLVKPLGDGQVLEDVLKEEEMLQSMDDKSVRCMNGYRVADQILGLVPDQAAFRQTLRFIKCWARRRGIYSNVLGFFGGITWALLVAHVCQLFPYYCPSQLVRQFFSVYAGWAWPRPVMLCDVVEPPDLPASVTARAGVWDPTKNPGDRQHVMPVITPAFPPMNSTHNVTETTKRIIVDEIRRGFCVVTSERKAALAEVHDPFPYFARFRQFLWLEILAKSDEVYQKFSGYVESKLRILTRQLEVTSGMVRGMIVHPNPEQYDLRGSDGEWHLGCGMFVAMAFVKDQGAKIGQTIDLRPAITAFVDVIGQWPERHQYGGQFLLRMRRIAGHELPAYALAAEAEKKRRQPVGSAAVDGRVRHGAGD